MYHLATMYQVGLGVAKDLREAADPFARAAREGNHAAQHNCGVALVLGEGVAQDLVEGLAWLFVERGNNSEATAYIEQLSGVLPHRTVARARKAALAWHARHSKSNQPTPAGLVKHPGRGPGRPASRFYNTRRRA